MITFPIAENILHFHLNINWKNGGSKGRQTKKRKAQEVNEEYFWMESQWKESNRIGIYVLCFISVYTAHIKARCGWNCLIYSVMPFPVKWFPD